MTIRRLEWVVMKDSTSKWDGVAAKVAAGGDYMERSVVPGEIAVFEPTSNVISVEIEHETREGKVMKEVTARVFIRTGTRLV